MRRIIKLKDPVEVAKAALVEAGRSDLAARVNSNRGGWPSIWHADIDSPVIIKAFWLGHISTGHRAVIKNDGINCEDCWESYA